MKHTFLIAAGIAGCVIALLFVLRENPIEPAGTSPTVSVRVSPAPEELVAPLPDARGRVSKKPFGLRVSPADSPVTPERFSGYHTGVDFETFPDEQEVDVPVVAVCTGPLLERRTATGYGGVAVQSCELDGAPVTVIYGHLRLSSVAATVGSRVVSGQQLGVLGTGYTAETGGERKHLHLGIHRGGSVSLLGYVPNSDALASWVDIMHYLP